MKGAFPQTQGKIEPAIKSLVSLHPSNPVSAHIYLHSPFMNMLCVALAWDSSCDVSTSDNGRIDMQWVLILRVLPLSYRTCLTPVKPTSSTSAVYLIFAFYEVLFRCQTHDCCSGLGCSGLMFLLDTRGPLIMRVLGRNFCFGQKWVWFWHYAESNFGQPEAEPKANFRSNLALFRITKDRHM